MKIRTITTGIKLKTPLSKKQVREAAQFTLKAKQPSRRKGYRFRTSTDSRLAGGEVAYRSSTFSDLVVKKDSGGRFFVAGGSHVLSIGTTIDP